MDALPEVIAPRGSWDLGGFVLDLDRAALTYPAGGPVALRPKTFALLECLVGQAGRVVGREALLDAVWPGVTVTDESLSQAVAELRQALGEAGRRLIRTVPRRGYLLDVRPVRILERPTSGEVASPVPQAGGAMPAGLRRGLGMLLQPAVLWSVVVIVAAGLATTWFARAPAPSAVAPAIAPMAAGNPRAVAERLTREADRLSYPSTGAPDPLAARALLDRAMAADPSYAPAVAAAAYTHSSMVLRGMSMDAPEDIRRAIALVERATLLAPNLPATILARGEVLRIQGRYPEALEAYRAVIAREPGLHPARAIIGWLLVSLGRPAEALEPLRTSLALGGSGHFRGSLWLAYLGIAKLHAGVDDFGAEELRRSLQGQSRQASRDDLQLQLAAALALSGRLEEARAVAAEVIGRSPRHTIGWFRRRPLSDHPDHLAQREPVLRGLLLAGVPE